MAWQAASAAGQRGWMRRVQWLRPVSDAGPGCTGGSMAVTYNARHLVPQALVQHELFRRHQVLVRKSRSTIQGRWRRALLTESHTAASSSALEALETLGTVPSSEEAGSRSAEPSAEHSVDTGDASVLLDAGRWLKNIRSSFVM